jgi:hypothetical protein
MFKKKDKKKNKQIKPVKNESVLISPDFQEEEVEQSLRTIYQASEGEMPDMTKLEIIKSKRWIWISSGIIAGLLVLITASWAGFSFFKTFQGFDGNGLELIVEGPEQITLGQEVTFFINYKNPMQQPLAAVDVRVNFPADFVIVEMNPQSNAVGSVWKLGSLAAEQRGTIKIRGTFTGALDTISAVQAIATYRPANYSSDFEAMATKQIYYSNTVLEGSIIVPEKAVPGDEISIVYQYKNTGTEVLTDLHTQITIPDGFSVNIDQMSSSSALGRILITPIGSLNAGEQGEVKVSGVFASGYGGDAFIYAQMGRVGNGTQFSPMQKAEAVIPVLAGDLSLALIVNGSEQNKRSISYGDELRGIIGYENTADEDLSDIVFKINLEAIDLNTGETLAKNQLVDFAKINASATNTVSGTQLIWDGKNVANLSKLAPRSGGNIDITIPIIKKAPTSGAVALRVTLSADIKSIGQTELNRTVAMAPMMFVLLSDVALQAEARYFTEEGAPIGSGPLPPVVGRQTSYRIVWRLNKTVHSLKDLEVSAKLPRSVNFSGIATSTAGEVVFDESSRLVSWKLNRMPAEITEAETEFNIVLTPVAADDGRFAILMEDIAFTASDEDISEQILLVVKQLNTDLQNDENAAGKGVVVK